MEQQNSRISQDQVDSVDIRRPFSIAVDTRHVEAKLDKTQPEHASVHQKLYKQSEFDENLIEFTVLFDRTE